MDTSYQPVTLTTSAVLNLLSHKDDANCGKPVFKLLQRMPHDVSFSKDAEKGRDSSSNPADRVYKIAS
jgi:hypothetical protein